ncbi:MAG: outer membrane beta-barrel protein [Bdellovibrionales bacterium]|nr:outer membrane beta-barrel protein [Bdellovibrionales bacterium]
MSAQTYAEMYTLANFNRPLTKTNPYRYYDFDNGQLSLGLIEFAIIGESSNGEKAVIDFDFGSFADANAPSTDPTHFVGQAVLSAPIGSGLRLDAGKFYSPMGFEVVKAKDCWNFSRSALFSYTIPFWHIGLRLASQLNDATALSVLVVNGWNNSVDNNRAQSLGLGYSTVFAEDISLNLNWLAGPEQAGDESNWRNTSEANIAFNALGLAWGVDSVFGEERDARWYGLAIFSKAQFTDRSFVAVRGETLTDEKSTVLSRPTGMTFQGQTLQTATLTFGYDFSQGVKTRTELRLDSSSQDVFSSETGSRKTQTTALLGLLFEIK